MLSKIEKGKFPAHHYLTSNRRDWQDQVRTLASRIHELICDADFLTRMVHTSALNRIGEDLQTVEGRQGALCGDDPEMSLLKNLQICFQRMLEICELPREIVAPGLNLPPLGKSIDQTEKKRLSHLLASLLAQLRYLIMLLKLEFQSAHFALVSRFCERRVTRLQIGLLRANRRARRQSRDQGGGICRDRSEQSRLERAKRSNAQARTQSLLFRARADVARARNNLVGIDVLLAKKLRQLVSSGSLDGQTEGEHKVGPGPESWDLRALQIRRKRWDAQYSALSDSARSNLQMLKRAQKVLRVL